MFSFGEISVQIAGSAKLDALLSTSWKKYKKESQELPDPLIMNVEEATLPFETFDIDGWSIISHGKRQQVLYSTKGRTPFALEYEACSNRVRVLYAGVRYRDALLGIQFGLLTALHRQCFGLHGVTLLCKNEIVILSAPSGTGKTTLAHLLETFCDAIVINGDFALLSPTSEGVIFEPTPFCGTSGRCLNHRVRINRIVFLEQGKDNQWSTLTGREAMVRLMNNTFVPTWDDSMRQAIQDNITKCISALALNVFSFAPTREAAVLFNRHLL